MCSLSYWFNSPLSPFETFTSLSLLLFYYSLFPNCLLFIFYESKFPELSLQCLLTYILYSPTPVLSHSLGKSPTVVIPTLLLICPCPYIAEHGQKKIALLTHLQLRSIPQGIPWWSVVKTSTAGGTVSIAGLGTKKSYAMWGGQKI